jgi:uncharacterized protein (TIGR00290 family)
MDALEDQSDYYWEGNFIVFTEAYHLKRGYCCNSGCRHCPYRSQKQEVKKKVTVSWSGGKDSAFALYKTLASQTYDVVGLHTVIDEQTKRVGLHGVPETLIEQQAEALGFALDKIYLPSSDGTQRYERCMQDFYQQCIKRNMHGIVFGDIFLEDLKQYRLNLLQPFKLFASFPLWGIDTRVLVRDFIATGFKSVICAADASLLTTQNVGALLDENLLKSLSPAVDPCGENGEFHSFVYDGPIFNRAILPKKGDVVKKIYTYNKTNEDGAIEKVESTFLFLDLS